MTEPEQGGFAMVISGIISHRGHVSTVAIRRQTNVTNSTQTKANHAQIQKVMIIIMPPCAMGKPIYPANQKKLLPKTAAAASAIPVLGAIGRAKRLVMSTIVAVRIQTVKSLMGMIW